MLGHKEENVPFMKELDEKIEIRSGYNREIHLGSVIKFKNVTNTYVEPSLSLRDSLSRCLLHQFSF